MHVSNSSNQRIISSRIHNNRLEDNEVGKHGESVPPTPTMASQPPNLPLITFMTSTFSVVQPVDLPPATLMGSFLLFDENPNEDPRMHVQSFSYVVVMNLVNDDCYVLQWFYSTLKGTALEWFWSNPTALF